MNFPPPPLCLLVAGFLVAGVVHPATAQQPTPTATPLQAVAATETTVYLRHDYTDSLKEAKLFDSDRFVARFGGFDGDFAIFKQKGSTESIYIPKSAILYMRRPAERMGAGY